MHFLPPFQGGIEGGSGSKVGATPCGCPSYVIPTEVFYRAEGSLRLMNKKISSYIPGGLMALTIVVLALFIGPDANASTPSSDPSQLTLMILNTLVFFQGIVSVVLIIFGGFKWLIFRRNEVKVKKAKQLMLFGLTSLIIVILVLASFIFVVSKIV